MATGHGSPGRSYSDCGALDLSSNSSFKGYNTGEEEEEEERLESRKRKAEGYSYFFCI